MAYSVVVDDEHWSGVSILATTSVVHKLCIPQLQLAVVHQLD